jgi:uncharacterized protein YjiS (DUF1127 family)
MTSLAEFGRTVTHFFVGMRKRRRLRRELDHLAAMGSLDAVLADIGLSRSQIESLIAGCAESGEELHRMLARLGVDPARLPIESLRDMTWTCTSCPDKAKCREWLAGVDRPQYRSFCPNAEQLDYALSERPRSQV